MVKLNTGENMRILEIFKTKNVKLCNKATILALRFSFHLSEEYAKGKADYVKRNKDVPYIYLAPQTYIGSQPYSVAYDIYLTRKLKTILNKYNLEIKDEDYMGITAYSIYQDREKITEFFNTDEYSKMEEVYWFIKNNYKE